MEHYKSDMIYGKLVTQQIENQIRAKNISESQLAQDFQHTSQKTSKILLFLLIPFSALILYVLYPMKKRFLYDNFILATEINGFYILIFFLFLPTLLFGINYFYPFVITDNVLGVSMLGVFLIYMSYLLRKVFKQKWWITILKGFVFIILHLIILQFVYKIIVFEVTIFLL